ncbi:MAG: hypothetical protein R3A51_18555, partial [Nannocystaceae bacterium]
MTDARGELREATRMRLVDVALDRPALTRAVETAVAHILASQAEDGRFRYLLDPYTGRSSWRGFGIPRQAGTTLALCEVGPRSAEVDAAAAKSLAMMASAAHEVAGERAAIAYEAPGRKVRRASLGSTALALVAFLSCRDRVGDRHDRLIGMLARLLISMQRDDGGFAPVFDLAAARPLDGPTPMYAEGQVVFGLSLAEALAGELGDGGPLPEVAALRDAVERAMSYVAHDYWDHGLRDFFFVEENWHCLAARASLGHHRNRDYERFCIDYVAFKARIIYDEDSRVRFDLVGGYGFGNVLPPHNTPTGGYGEALAAAMALKRADGLDTSEDDARMARALKFLVRQQWSADNCFACAPEHVVIGGFSESMASPILRIDYVQHTLSGLGHGGRLLGLLDPPAPAPDAS